MSLSIPSSAVAVSVGTVALVLKFYFVLMKQGGARFKAGSRPPEDMALSLNKTVGKGKKQQFVPRDDIPAGVRDEENRWSRIVMNDLENVPLGLILMWAGHLSDVGKIHSVLAILFVIGRILHTYAYANAKQPMRAIAWFLAVLSNVAMSVNLAWSLAL
eukprot:TRINITY_DN2789_c0_g1_i1.p1 TRINITY_DN2789_c0_g1~~TRINITY_DN2789_c0_g1_i1.p1  ORF type:complete len:166 (-),score=46.19 TRINITY_DN2789_c0_g1_i1:126-602(-)